jgi:hypothetical protein
MTKHSGNHQTSEPGMGSSINEKLPRAGNYPLLEAVLQARSLPLLATYTYRDATSIFGCSIRSLQERIRRGQLRKRNLPGRAKFLSIDLEDFLQNSLTTK